MEAILDDPQRLLTRYGIALTFRPRNAEALVHRSCPRPGPPGALGQSAGQLAAHRRGVAPARSAGVVPRRPIQLTLGRLDEAVASRTASHRLPCGAGRSSLFELAEASLLNAAAWQCVADPTRRHDPARALPLILAAIEILPGRPTATRWASPITGSARHREAIDCFERNLDQQRRSNLPDDLYFLAMSHHRAGDPAKARAAFDRAVEVQGKLDLTPPRMAEMNASSRRGRTHARELELHAWVAHA